MRRDRRILIIHNPIFRIRPKIRISDEIYKAKADIKTLRTKRAYRLPAADVIYHPPKVRNRIPFELQCSATTHFKGFVELSSLPMYFPIFWCADLKYITSAYNATSARQTYSSVSTVSRNNFWF